LLYNIEIFYSDSISCKFPVYVLCTVQSCSNGAFKNEILNFLGRPIVTFSWGIVPLRLSSFSSPQEKTNPVMPNSILNYFAKKPSRPFSDATTVSEAPSPPKVDSKRAAQSTDKNHLGDHSDAVCITEEGARNATTAQGCQQQRNSKENAKRSRPEEGDGKY